MWKSLFSGRNLNLFILCFFVINIILFGLHFFQEKKTQNPKTVARTVSFRDFPSKPLKFAGRPDGKGGVLILRFVRNDCNECVDSIFNNTIKLARRFGKESVQVVVSNHYSEEQYETISRLHQYDLNITQIGDLLNSADKTGLCYYYFFTRDRPKVARKVFLIRQTMDAGYSEAYNQWIAEAESSGLFSML